MKSLFLSLLLVPLAWAQTLTPSTAGTAPAGGYAPGAVVPISITAAGNPTKTGIQFDIQTSAGVANVVVSIPSALASTKQVSCDPFAASMTCLVVGFDTATIPDGVVATANVTLASTLSASAPVTVTIANPVETDATGTALAVTVANPTVSLSIQNPCAVTGDGSVSSGDFSAEISAALAHATTPDLNSDGKVNVQDVQIVATAGTPPNFVCNAR